MIPPVLRSAYLLALFALLWCAPTAHAESIEVITLPAKKVPVLVDRAVDRMDFYAYRSGHLSQIPWQWDPVDREGWVRFEKVPGMQLVAPRDWLLWMVKDLGGEAPSAALRAACAECEWRKIAFASNDAKPRYLYAMFAKRQIEPTTVDYVHFEAAQDLALTPSYYVGYRDVIVANQFGHVHEDQVLGRNLIDQVLVSFSARFLFGLLPLKVTEKDLQSRHLGDRDGKIRVIQRLSTRFKLGLGVKGPSNIAESYFYPNYYHTKIDIHFPVGGKAVIRDSMFRFNIDMTPPDHDVLIHLPPAHVFTVGKDQPLGLSSLLTEAPGWANFSELGTANEFLVHIAIPEAKREVIQIKKLEFNHEPTDKKIGTMTLDVTLNTVPGDHSFALYLFTPPTQLGKDSTKVFARMKEYAHMLASPTHLISIEDPFAP